MAPQHAQKFGSILFMLIGGAFAVIGTVFMYQSVQLVVHGTETTGQVLEVVRSRDSDGDTSYKPVISFTTLSGEEVTFTSKVSSSSFNYSVGQTVSVVYQQSSPQYPLKLEEDIFLYDTEHGLPDLATGIIRTVGNPHKRFEEDALRLLRAIRFSVQLDMSIEHATWEAITEQSKLIAHVSGERVRDEFLKMLGSAQPKRAIELLDEAGLLDHILPELLQGKSVFQGGHHTTDVWTHSLDALAACPSPDPIVRLATLIHDIGKPETVRYSDGKPTFYNHEVVGSRIAKNICYRLRLSKQESEKIFILVRQHMFHYQPHNTDASIRRFMRNVGLEHIDDILDLREADRLGSGARKTSWRLEEMKERMLSQLHQPFDITDLAINGHDLIESLGMKPGREIGEILTQLFSVVLEEPEKNTRDTLLALAEKLLHSK